MGSVAIAATVGKSVLTVRRWRRRYAKAGVEGLLRDATLPPGRKPLTPEMINRNVQCHGLCVNLLARSTGNHKRSPSYCATNWIEGSSIMWAAKYRAVPPDMHVLTTRAASIVIKNPWVEGFAAVVLWAETLIVTSASQSSVHRLSLGAPAGSLHECERREILMALGLCIIENRAELGKFDLFVVTDSSTVNRRKCPSPLSSPMHGWTLSESASCARLEKRAVPF
jgi:hypothetical protein